MSERVNLRAFWCDLCHVPLIGNICHACGSAGREIATASFVPVFSEEIKYLTNRVTPELQSFLYDMEIWVTPSNHTYYGHGEALFRLSSTSAEIHDLKTPTYSANYSSRSQDKALQILRNANRPYIEQMQYEAEEFIRETISEYKKLPVLVSFSGGKDSTVVSHLVMNALGKSDILHIFADTTIEFPDTYRYINKFQQEHPLTPFITSRSQLDFFETAKSIGPPSRILRWCCTTHKTNPLSKIINSLSPNKGVLTFDGVRKSESTRRSKYERITKQHKIVNEILASPIIEWSDLAVWIYMLFHGLNFNKAYKKGFRRVGCLYCPFNSDWSYKITKERYPKNYERWQTFLMEQALRMAHPDPENFVDKGWRARAGGRGLDYYKTSIESAPCLLSDTALSYQLLSGDIRSVRYFLRPLGPQTWIRSNNYSEIFLIHDHITNAMLASVEVSFQDKVVRINYLIEKGKLVFKQRIEKQLKKLQSCIKCGACGAKCLLKAIAITNQSFFIDENKCVSCLACVKHRCPAVDSLKKRGK